MTKSWRNDDPSYTNLAKHGVTTADGRVEIRPSSWKCDCGATNSDTDSNCYSCLKAHSDQS